MNTCKGQIFFTKISFKVPAIGELNNHDKFVYLMSYKDSQILTWFGNHSISAIRKSMGRVLPPNSDILPVPTDELQRNFTNNEITFISDYVLC